jgi:hypothetical protein
MQSCIIAGSFAKWNRKGDSQPARRSTLQTRDKNSAERGEGLLYSSQNL